MHLVMDHYATPKKTTIATGWSPSPASTATSPRHPGPRVNLAEVWFGVIERQAIHRGSFRAVKDFNADPCLHRRLERPRTPVRVDQDRRRDPQEGQPSGHFKHWPLAPKPRVGNVEGNDMTTHRVDWQQIVPIMGFDNNRPVDQPCEG